MSLFVRTNISLYAKRFSLSKDAACDSLRGGVLSARNAKLDLSIFMERSVAMQLSIERMDSVPISVSVEGAWASDMCVA